MWIELVPRRGGLVTVVNFGQGLWLCRYIERCDGYNAQIFINCHTQQLKYYRVSGGKIYRRNVSKNMDAGLTDHLTSSTTEICVLRWLRFSSPTPSEANMISILTRDFQLMLASDCGSKLKLCRNQIDKRSDLQNSSVKLKYNYLAV